MADEQQPDVGMESEEFDWGKWFAEGDDGGQSSSPVESEESTPPPPVMEDDADDADEVERLRQQVEALSKTVQTTLTTTQEIAQRDKVKAAVEAWKAQASPAELAMAPLLEEAGSLDDLKTRESVIKQATGLLDKSRQQIEQDVQRKFGLPVQPTFSPVPEEERVKQMLEEGDIDGASNAILKGVFNS